MDDSFISPSQDWLSALSTPLIVGVVAVMVATVILGRKLLVLRAGLKRGYAGSQLQTSMVKAFALVTITPTIVISLFSLFFFYYGLQDWFNQRVTTVLEESVAVAEAYLDEHEMTLRADAQAMANDLLRDLHLTTTNPLRFSTILNSQVALRSLSEAMVLRQDRIIARSQLSYSYSFERVPDEAIFTARNGDVAVLEHEDRMFGVIAIDPFTETYLVVSRLVDKKVITHIEQSKGAADDYRRLRDTINQFQVSFILVFILVTILLLLGVIWYGTTLAARISRPITTVAQATERVRAGDYSIRIEDDTNDEELDRLIHHFNRMTEQLYTQRLELTQVNRMLDQRRRFSETVLSGVSAGIVALDTSLAVRLCNASALSLLGYGSERELIGRSLRALIPEFDNILQRVNSDSQAIHQDQVTANIHGKPLILQVKISAEITQTYIEGYIVTLDDITPLISAQRSAAWSDVARRVAHEIKNPLTPIKLSAERLRKKFAPDDAEKQESFYKYIDTIIRNLTDIGTIVEEFSSFARMPAPRMQPANLGDIIGKAVFAAETSYSDINVSLSIDDKHAMNVICDEGQLHQVFNNILKNAAESIERQSEHHPDIKGTISVTCIVEHELINVTIADNGIGFPEHLLHKIMEPYVTTRAKGTGLGLAIVKKIVEDHKGTIIIGNHPDGGAQIFITLPRIIAINSASE